MNEFNSEFVSSKNKYIEENLNEFARMNQYGKYIRGTLVNIGYHLIKEKPIYYSDDLALAFELFQTSILIHDDIIDHSTLRRNTLTIPVNYCERWKKKKYGNCEDNIDIANSMALCSGDIGLYLPLQKICESYKNDKKLSELMSYFIDIAINTIKGEIIDIILPFEEYYKETDFKTLNTSIYNIYKMKTS